MGRDQRVTVSVGCRLGAATVPLPVVLVARSVLVSVLVGGMTSPVAGVAERYKIFVTIVSLVLVDVMDVEGLWPGVTTTGTPVPITLADVAS